MTGLLFGLVWQIGACPCGCLDHNLWLGIMRSVLGESQVAETQLAGSSVRAEDCDHRPRDAYVQERTSREDGRAASVVVHSTVVADPLSLVVGALIRDGTTTGQRLGRARFSDAQEVRAHLQVFRI